MSQVQNLMQLFLNRSNSPVPSSNGADIKTGSSKEKTAAPFHAKVLASHAQLTANTATANTSTTNNSNGKARAKAKADAQSRSLKTMDAAMANKQTSHAKNSEPQPTSPAKPKAPISKIEKQDQGDTHGEVKTTQPKDNAGIKKSAEKIAPVSAETQALDGKAEVALRNRLEKMGITATDEQLADADFLSDMLQLLQSMMPNAALPLPEEGGVPVDGEAVIEGEFPVGTTLPAGDGGISPTMEQNGTEGQEPKSIVEIPTEKDSGPSVRMGGDQNSISEKSGPLGSDQKSTPKDLSELIKERLFELAQISKSQNAEPSIASRLTQDATPQGWDELGLPEGDKAKVAEQDVLRDLDRLRVLQAAAFNASKSGDPESLHGNVEASPDEVDKIDELGAQPASASEKSNGHQNRDGQSNNFSRNQEQPQPAQNSSLTESLAISKDGPTGSVFHSTQDQVRGTEMKAATEPIRGPQQSAFDQGILQQISKKLSAVTLRNGGEISIQMEPENLGKIRVGLGLKDGIMTARIGVENENIRQIVQANLASLRETLENQGITLQGLDVSVDQHHSSLFNPDGSNSEAFFHRRGQGEGAISDSDSPSLEIAPESDTGRRWGYNTMEYIG